MAAAITATSTGPATVKSCVVSSARNVMASGAPITVEKLALNAVLAGCRPEYFPVVIAAFEAMADPSFRFFHAVTMTHPGGVAVVVSGPLAKEIGLHAGLGALGPGFRANATIGRVVNLALIRLKRARPEAPFRVPGFVPWAGLVGSGAALAASVAGS